MDKEFIVNTGRIIKEYMASRDITQKDLAIRTGISEKHISNMLNGKSRLTEDMALKLECVMPDVKADYWLKYEQKYREYLARNKQENDLSKEDLVSISKRFHFCDVFKGLDWSLEKQALEMLKILGISDFNCFDAVYDKFETAFMEDGGEKEAIAIWLRLCEEQIDIQNKDIENQEFDKNKLEEKLRLFRNFVLIDSIEGITTNCRRLCNRLGIYLVIYPTITNCKVRGALKTYLGKPAIFLSGRFNTMDHIWFAFFHEIGHLLKHYDSKYFELSIEGDSSLEEVEANSFARDLLVDSKCYCDFVNEFGGKISKEDIVVFAKEQNTLPGIVVGRLQHDGVIEQNQFNMFKNKIDMKEVIT